MMKNTKMRVEGSRLIIEVNLDAEAALSKSGKTMIVASTSGNIRIPNREERIGLNVYRKIEKKEDKTDKPIIPADPNKVPWSKTLPKGKTE